MESQHTGITISTIYLKASSFNPQSSALSLTFPNVEPIFTMLLAHELFDALPVHVIEVGSFIGCVALILKMAFIRRKRSKGSLKS